MRRVARKRKAEARKSEAIPLATTPPPRDGLSRCEVASPLTRTEDDEMNRVLSIIATGCLLLTSGCGVCTFVHPNTGERYCTDNQGQDNCEGWPADLSATWLQLKLVAVLGLVIYHVVCGVYVTRVGRGERDKTHVFYRIFNEIPVLFLLLIVVLAVVRPL